MGIPDSAIALLRLVLGGSLQMGKIGEIKFKIMAPAIPRGWRRICRLSKQEEGVLLGADLSLWGVSFR